MAEALLLNLVGWTGGIESKLVPVNGDGVSDALCVEKVSLQIEVVDSVSRLVIILIVGKVDRAAEQLDILSGFDIFRASKQSTGGDIVEDESFIVGASVKCSRSVVLAHWEV